MFVQRLCSVIFCSVGSIAATVLVLNWASVNNAVAQPNNASTSRCKEIVRQLSIGKFDQAVKGFSKGLLSRINAKVLQEKWSELEQKYGQYKQSGEPKVQALGKLFTVTLPMQFERALINLNVLLDYKNEIIGFTFNLNTDDSVGETTLEIKSGEFALDALYTVPKGVSQFPVVVLVHGSGPQDKDETIGPNRPFRDLAYGLAARGIGCLRYDKRTLQYPKKMNLKSITVQEETIDDAVNAARQAMTLPGADKNKIFVLGHSLGGYLVPRIAQRLSDAHGFIVFAGNARPLEDLLLEQITYVSSLKKEKDPSHDLKMERLKQQVSLVKSDKLNLETDTTSLPFGIPASYWIDLKNYDPVYVASKLPQPIMVLQGGRDYQVTTSGDFDLWKQKLESNEKNVLKLYPDLNHLFIVGEGTAVPEEYFFKPGHVDDQVLDDISEFVKK